MLSVFKEFEFTVDSRHVDMFKQCRPSALLGFLQEAATLAALDLGASGPEVEKKYGCLWMISRIWVEMEKPLRWNDKITVRTWHRGAAGASSYRDFDIYRNGEYVGQGVSNWVLVEIAERRLFRMKQLAEFQGTDGGELCKDIKLRRVKLPEEMSGGEQRPMRYSDTDINGHINNAHYADFACDALHLEQLGEGKFVRSFQIGYLGECLAGETVSIRAARQGEELFARGEGADGSERFEFHMVLETLN